VDALVHLDVDVGQDAGLLAGVEELSVASLMAVMSALMGESKPRIWRLRSKNSATLISFWPRASSSAMGPFVLRLAGSFAPSSVACPLAALTLRHPPVHPASPSGPGFERGSISGGFAYLGSNLKPDSTVWTVTG